MKLSWNMQPMLVLIEHWLLFSLINGNIVLQAGLSGLVNALKLLQPIKEKYSGVTYADLFQLASATAVEVVLTPTLEVFLNRIYKLKKIYYDQFLGNFRKLGAPKSPWSMEEWMSQHLSSVQKKGGFLVRSTEYAGICILQKEWYSL